MRPIDADALLTVPNVQKVTEYDETGEGITYLAVPVEAIEKTPTIEVEPVRHGKWALCEGFMICCECGASPADWEAKPNNPLGLPPFCHSCGLKMDLEGE